MSTQSIRSKIIDATRSKNGIRLIGDDKVDALVEIVRDLIDPMEELDNTLHEPDIAIESRNELRRELLDKLGGKHE